jgi:hypothetical protein
VSAHMPGPWVVTRGTEWWDREVWTGGPSYTQPICKLSESESERSQIEANARLIANAPELLEALKDLLAYLQEGIGDYESGEAFKARLAIAKATGGAL